MYCLDINNIDASYSEEFIKQVHDFAYKMMSIEDIAALLDIDEEMLSFIIKDGNNSIAKAYRKGKAEITLHLHEQELELADAGSAQGMANLHEFLARMDADNV